MLKTKKTMIFDICITAMLIALILVLNIILENVKIFQFSIQLFLIFYAIGIYKISNGLINIFFILIVPPILFAFEQNAYIINAMQVFFEYFLVFYIFSILLLIRFISNLFQNNKHYKLIFYINFVTSFSLLIVFKYVLHCLASLTGGNKEPLASFAFNLPGLFTNLFLIPATIIIAFPVFQLFDHYNYQLQNKG